MSNQPEENFVIRLLTSEDWQAYRQLWLDLAKAAHPRVDLFEGNIETVEARPDAYWQNVVNCFSHFGGFDGKGALLAVLGVVVLPLKDGTHTGHVFGRGLSPQANAQTFDQVEKFFLDKGVHYRSLYKDLNQLFDFRGNAADFVEWLGVKSDLNQLVTGSSPFVLKED